MIRASIIKVPNSTWHPVGAQKQNKQTRFLIPTSVGYLVMLNKCLLGELYENN